MRRISTLQVLGLGLVAASCALSSAALAGGNQGGHRGHHGVRVYQGAVAPKVQVFHHRHQGHHAHQGHHGYHQGGYRYAPQHPSGVPWPPVPPALLALWQAVVPAARLT